jgi:hypothetical protein
MKKFLAAIVVTTVIALQAPAYAAVVNISTIPGPALSPGFLGGVEGSTYITFEDVAVGTSGAFTSAGFNFSGMGSVQNTNVSGSYAPPAGDTSRFFTVGFDGQAGLKEATLTLTSSYTKFGLYWGSIDAYNTITFLKNGVEVASFTGSDVPQGNANGNQQNASANRYVNFDFVSDSFNSVVFRSTTPAFEMDNLALAGHAPELSTWAMMLFGFAGVGFVAYRRARKGEAAVEAA